MFDIPIAFTNKRVRAARKLKYQYCNSMSRKYKATQGIIENGLPTPENSANEVSENEEATQKKRRRLKRRWHTILGESYSDCDTDDDNIEGMDEATNESGNSDENQEKLFFKNYEKPQESYEKWQTDPKKRVPINRSKITFSKFNRLQKHSKRNLDKSLMFASQKNKFYFNAITQGLEYIDPLLESNNNYHVKHIQILTTLVQLHVSRHDWDLAYKCFALLIRMPRVDIRNLWGLGERILAEREPLKSIEFLEWMNNMYSSKITFSEEANYHTAPVFTKGSKNHVPKFTIALLWETLIRASKNTEEFSNLDNETESDTLQDLIDRISELVLGPPFMDNSEIWFIYALCHIVKADQLSEQFSRNLIGSARDIASNQVFQHIQSAKTSLHTCSSKGDFYFPKRRIEKQLEGIEQRLQQTDDFLDFNEQDEQDEEVDYDNLDTQIYESEYSISDDTS